MVHGITDPPLSLYTTIEVSNKRCPSPTYMPTNEKAAGLEFSAGDTFGFRNRTSPSYQLSVDHPVMTCACRGLAAVVPFEYCAKVHYTYLHSSRSDTCLCRC